MSQMMTSIMRYANTQMRLLTLKVMLTSSLQPLRSHYRTLSRVLCPATAVDVFSILPLEIIEMIFHHLSFARMWYV